jgi:hypothetical protein
MAGFRLMTGRVRLRAVSAIAVLLMAASCTVVPRSVPPPTPPVPAAKTPTPPPTQIAVPPRQEAWDLREIMAGEWRYDPAARVAAFVAGEATLASLSCDGSSITVRASLGTGDRTQRVDLSTSFGTDALELVSDAITLSAQDARLDHIAFSRGRFALDAANGSSLTLPTHAEIGRVIEDCRG